MNDRILGNRIEDVKKYVDEQLQFLEEREARQIRNRLFDRLFALSSSDVVLKGKERLSESQILLAHFAVKRLKLGEPVQYVLAEGPFLHFNLKVNPHVLIPRPETEELVISIQTYFKTHPHPRRILDVGTGSGCIAIALKSFFPYAYVEAWDISPEAVEVAQENTVNHHADVHVKVKDMLETWDTQEWDLVVSNPPYIPFQDGAAMDDRVTAYEPHLALFVEQDNPMKFYDAILENTQTRLSENGILVFETNDVLPDQWLDQQRDKGWILKQEKDMQSRLRFLWASKIKSH